MNKKGRQGALCLFMVMSAALAVVFLGTGRAQATSLLYSASLANGDYGGGFQVGAYSSSSPYNASGSVGGDLSVLGVVDSPAGVTFTTNHDVINYSLGADGLGGVKQADFRTSGTISVRFEADWQTFNNGQVIVDNYGFNQYHTGQGTFGVFLTRGAGPDGTFNTSDDTISVTWQTWHSGSFLAHPTVLTTMGQWHDMSLAWDAGANKYDIWLDGTLKSTFNVPAGYSTTWGSSSLGLGSAYNVALGEIHERIFGDSSPHEVMLSDLAIWDGYQPRAAVQGVVPEPSTVVLVVLSVGAIAWRCRRRFRLSVASC